MLFSVNNKKRKERTPPTHTHNISTHVYFYLKSGYAPVIIQKNGGQMFQAILKMQYKYFSFVLYWVFQ